MKGKGKGRGDRGVELREGIELREGKRGVELREGTMGARRRNVVKGGGKVGRLRVRQGEGLREKKGERAGKRGKG